MAFHNFKAKFICILITITFLLPLYFYLDKSSTFLALLFSSILVLVGIFASLVLYKKILPAFQIRLDRYPVHWRWFIVVFSAVFGMWLVLNIPLVVPPIERTPFLPSLFVRLSYRVFSGIAICTIILVISLVAASKLAFPPYNRVNNGQSAYLKYFIPIILVWGIYLLAFYPGMMSADSLVQWDQIITGIYNDHHPPFHTFTIWLVTRVAFTPTAVAVAQILFLGFVASQWFVFFEQIGLPKWLIWLGLSIFSLSPVNGTMVNTLWKDIPFSTSVLALSLLLAKVVFSDGEWIQSRMSKILLGIICALVLLFRHDGLPLGVGSLAALFVFYPKKFKSWLIATTICFGLYLGVRGPLYQAVGVQKSTVLAESSLSLYSMAAYAKQGSQAEQLIQSFQLVSPNWECSLAGKIQPEWRTTDLDYSQSAGRIVVNLVQRMPRVLLYFYRCARSMEWIVRDPYGEVRNASHVEVLVDPNPYGIQHASKFLWFRDFIAKWVVETSHNPSLNWFTWRPAFFLYFNLFVSLILVLRNLSLRFGLISLPILIQSITFSLIFAEPNFRYHYAVYLVSLISWPLLFVSPKIGFTTDKP